MEEAQDRAPPAGGQVKLCPYKYLKTPTYDMIGQVDRS